MNPTAIKKIYEQKKRLLDQAEAKTRFALTHTRREAQIATALHERIHTLETQLQNIKSDLEPAMLLRDKPHSQKHYAHKIKEHLGRMNKTQQEAKELVTGLRNIKVHATKNVKSLCADMKKIGVLQKRMDRHLS